MRSFSRLVFIAALPTLFLSVALPIGAQQERPRRAEIGDVRQIGKFLQTARFPRTVTVAKSGAAAYLDRADFNELDAACAWVATQTRSATATWLVLVYPGDYTTDCAGAPVALPIFTTLVRFERLGPVVTGTSALFGTCQILTGAGTPEAAVTAPVCSLYLRTDGGASTTLYVKESGAGNTGWVAK